MRHARARTDVRQSCELTGMSTLSIVVVQRMYIQFNVFVRPETSRESEVCEEGMWKVPLLSQVRRF